MTDPAALLAPFRQACADPLAAPRAHRRAGGRVIGYVGDAVPTELIAAAGFLPYRLRGRDRPGVPLVERFVHPNFQKPAQERGIRLAEMESILDRLLAGDFAFLDHLVIPYGRREVAQLHGQIVAAARDLPPGHLPSTVILDRTMSSSFHASGFNRESLFRFRAWLESVIGQAITDEAIRREIAAANRQRAMLAEAMALRSGPVPRLGAADARAVNASAHLMPRADHLAALAGLVEAAGDLPPVFGVPLFVAGGAPDGDGVYRALAERGFHVCGEEGDWGQRVAEDPVDEALAPMEGLAERFHRHAPFTYPLARAATACADRAARAGARAALVRIVEGDMMAVFEASAIQAALADRGIPSFVLAEQPYGAGLPTSTSLDAFLAGIGGADA